MSRNATFGLLLLGGAALLFTATDAFSMINPAPIDPNQTDANGTTLAEKIAAMLATIRQFESGNDYYIIAGDGGHFSDESTHPFNDGNFKQRIPPAHLYVNGRSIPTTASGAYQIIFGTWLQFADQTGIYGFSPNEQDALGYAILASTGAIARLAENDIAGAFKLASRQWASLPGSTADQNPQPLTYALLVYQGNLA